jgi:caspase domain-containing protein
LIVNIAAERYHTIGLGGFAMARFVRASCLWLAALAALLVGQHSALAQEARFALVIGNDQYRTASLATPANDAGLVADALGAAGFAVTGARNLDQAALRESFREFLGQVASAGPNAVAVIYLSGFGLQFEGENYFVPVDADIQRDVECRLAFLAAALEPPPDFAIFDFSIAPPPPTEVVFVERPVIIFAGPGFAPPPPAPVIFLPPRPREFIALAPPPPPRERFALPISAAPIPTFVRPPRTVAVLPQQHQGTLVPGGSPTVPGGSPTAPGGPRRST